MVDMPVRSGEGCGPGAAVPYETGLNAMREDVLLRLFHVLQVEPNYLYQDDFESRQLSGDG